MISVIVPTYNRRDLLVRALVSVCGQTFPHWELLVVDDGSTDHTEEAVTALHDPRIRYLYQEHQGVSAARNQGIRHSRYSWVSFLDSDDYWNPRKLERQMQALKRRPHYQVVYTDEIWIRRGRRVNPKKIHRKYCGWIYHRCLPLCIISPSSVLLHRQVLDSGGWFDEALPVCEDYDLWLRVSARHPIYFLPEPLTIKTGGHSDQLSRSLWGLDRYRLLVLCRLYGSGRLTPQQRVWTAREVVVKARILATGFTHRGKPSEAEEYQRLVAEWAPLARDQRLVAAEGSGDAGAT